MEHLCKELEEEMEIITLFQNLKMTLILLILKENSQLRLFTRLGSV